MSNFFNSDNLQNLGLMMSAVGTYNDPDAFDSSLNLFNTLQRARQQDTAQREAFAQNAATRALFNPAASQSYSLTQPGKLTLNADGSVNGYKPPAAPVMGNLLNEQNRMQLLSTALGGRLGPLR